MQGPISRRHIPSFVAKLAGGPQAPLNMGTQRLGSELVVNFGGLFLYMCVETGISIDTQLER